MHLWIRKAQHQDYTKTSSAYESKEMSQGDICRVVGLDHDQMSNIEVGKGNSTLATIEKIAQALGVSSDELLK